MFFKKEREEARKKYNIDINLNIIKETIKNNQINELRKYLKSYLNQKNYTNYEYILNILIDIAIIKNDFTFLLEQLELIEKEEFTYLNSRYLNKYYESIANGDIEVAKIYLELINHHNNLSIINELRTYTNNYKDNRINDDVDNIYDKLVENGEIIKFIVPLKDKDLYISKLKEHKDILIYEINSEEECLIYLLFHPFLSFIELSQLKSKSREYYLDKKYQEALYYNLNILGRLTNPNDYLISRIGICYYKLKDYEKAIDYLSIAESICNDENKKERYHFLIRDIKTLLPKPKILSNNYIE